MIAKKPPGWTADREEHLKALEVSPFQIAALRKELTTFGPKPKPAMASKENARRAIDEIVGPLAAAHQALRWSRKSGQGFKVGSPLMKDGSDDWQTQALLG